MIRRHADALATGALVALSYAFRAPVLVNARATNSDAAVVGLQAMHLLRGELSPLLWGSGYQTSADAFVAAGFFAVLGPTPLALTLSALTLHVVLTLIVYATLRAHLPIVKATLLSLLLVFTTSAVHTYALYPPRQLSLTLAVAAFACIDVTSRGGRTRWLAIGGALSTLAAAADPYPLLLVPLAGLFGVLVVASRPRKVRALTALTSGLAVGAVPFVLVRHAQGASGGQLTLTLGALHRNAELLARDCLPWLLGLRTYVSRDTLVYGPWGAPLPARIVTTAGASAFLGLLAYALVRALRTRGAAARLGAVGLASVPLTLAAFVTSVMVSDHFSMRYLVAIPLLAPFALLPAARALSARALAVLLAIDLAGTAVSGWMSFTPLVAGPRIVTGALDPEADAALHDALVARGVRDATADYWASYRLTFLWREDVRVVPLVPEQDRYRPYRDAFERADLVAFVHDGFRSREDVDETARRAAAAGKELERFTVGRTKKLGNGYQVWIVERRR